MDGKQCSAFYLATLRDLTPDQVAIAAPWVASLVAGPTTTFAVVDMATGDKVWKGRACCHYAAIRLAIVERFGIQEEV